MKYFPAFACVLMFISTWACALMGNFNPRIDKQPSGWFLGALLCGGATIVTFVAAMEYFDEKGKR